MSCELLTITTLCETQMYQRQYPALCLEHPLLVLCTDLKRKYDPLSGHCTNLALLINNSGNVRFFAKYLSLR
jgi:hypothetical protein